MIAYEMKNILHFIATRCDSGDGRNSNFTFRSLNSPITRSIGTPACSTTEQAGSFFVCFAGNNRAIAAKNCIRTRLCRPFFVVCSSI